MNNPIAGLLLFAALLLAASAAECVTICLDADRESVPMGRTVVLDAALRLENGHPAAEWLCLPFVNGKRWGAHEWTDASGRARFLLPFPETGPKELRLLVKASARNTENGWIWAGDAADDSTAYMAGRFELDAAPEQARLHVVCDDSCTVFINGNPAGPEHTGWTRPSVYGGITNMLRRGENILAFTCVNSTGPAGLMARLEYDTETEKAGVFQTGESGWEGWREAPPGWPRPAVSGESAQHVAKIGRSVWSGSLGPWPGVESRELFITGRPAPEEGIFSEPLMITVTPRALPAPPEDRESVFIMQWEPWFTPHNAWWQTAQAVPVMGLYDSYNMDVIRQHVLWMMDAGVDIIMPDWSNHIWGKEHWHERGANTHEIIHATELMLENLAAMREEGLPVPQVVLMPGLSNGPPAAMEAVNEMLFWLQHHYIENPRFKGLWYLHEAKPLIVILDTQQIALKPDTPPVDETYFTVRWMSTQLQATKHHEQGYWSWMDGQAFPLITYRAGEAEAITAHTAFFGGGGWLYPPARGRLGGTTYIESFRPAFEERPRFIQLHQFNEFAGQPEGQGYGPDKDRYVDSYSVELSDDIEPVSMTAPGYRGDDGGWGYYYLNLTRALIDHYRGNAPGETILAVSHPARNEAVQGETLKAAWAWIGAAPEGFDIAIGGKTVKSGVQGNEAAIDISGLAPGMHMLRVSARGAVTRYRLQYLREDDPLQEPEPAIVEVPFTVSPFNG
jgi:hypothetical protein